MTTGEWTNPFNPGTTPSIEPEADLFDIFGGAQGTPPPLPSTPPHLAGGPGSPFVSPGGGPAPTGVPPTTSADADLFEQMFRPLKGTGDADAFMNQFGGPGKWTNPSDTSVLEDLAGGAMHPPSTGGMGFAEDAFKFPNLLKSHLADLPGDVMMHLRGLPGKPGLLAQGASKLPGVLNVLSKVGPGVDAVTGAYNAATAETPTSRWLHGIPAAANALSFFVPGGTQAASLADIAAVPMDAAVEWWNTESQPGPGMDADVARSKADALRYHLKKVSSNLEDSAGGGESAASTPPTGPGQSLAVPPKASGESRPSAPDPFSERLDIGHLQNANQKRSLYDYEKDLKASDPTKYADKGAFLAAIQHQLGVRNT